MVSMGRGQLNATAAPIYLLVQRLTQVLGRPVVDKTGLSGNFDYSLQWTPNQNDWASGDSSGTSIFTAVQEQLGLKLESQKGPVDIYVIAAIVAAIESMTSWTRTKDGEESNLKSRCSTYAHV